MKKEVIHMKCPNCGNDLPENVSFCPYCMVKFNENNVQVQSKPDKKKQNKMWIILGMAAVFFALIAVVVLIIVLSGQGDTDSESDKGNQINSGVDKNTDNASSNNINPIDYCGTWYSEEFDGESPELEGGNILKIISMTEDKVIFDLCSYQAPPNSRIAEIAAIEADIENGQAEFLFSNDGWGNGGIGTLLFLEGKIYVNIKLTSVSSDSLWNIGTDMKFKKVDDAYENDTIDFLGVVGENINVIKIMLKDFPYEFEKSETEYGAYQCGGILIGVEDDIITSLTIDYTQFPEGYRKKLCVSFGINGSASYEYVKNKLGEPIDVREDNGNYVSTFYAPEEGNCIKVAYYGGEVVYIRYFYVDR